MENYEVNTNHDLTNQFETIEKIINHLKDNSLQKKENEREAMDQEGKPQFKIIKGSLIQTKQAELARVFNYKNLDLTDMTHAQLYELSLDFVNIVDKGKSGELDYEEFYNFFANTEDIYLTDE